MSTTYTEEEVNAAIEEATKALRDELDARVASEEAAAVETRVAEAVAEKDGEIATLKNEIDSLTVQVAAAEAKYNELVELLEAEEARLAAEAELEARKEAVKEAAKELAFLSDEYVEKQIDRWVAMSEDDLAAHWTELKEVAAAASASKETTEEKAPKSTSMKASADSGNESDDFRSNIRDLGRHALTGTNFRSL